MSVVPAEEAIPSVATSLDGRAVNALQVSAWALPAEIGDNIISFLRKIEIKQLRLVSKGWNVLSIPHVFDRAWVSLRDIDVEALKGIAESEHLAPHVHTLLIDMSIVTDVSALPQFIVSLYLFAERYFDYFESLCSNNKDHPILRIAEDTRFTRLVDVDTLGPEGCGNWDQVVSFLKQAHHTWQDVCTQECGVAMQTISKLISLLPHLRHLKFDYDVWNISLKSVDDLAIDGSYNGYQIGRGPPFCKYWDPYHMRPINDFNYYDSRFIALFEAVIHSMAQTPRDIVSFECGLNHHVGLRLGILQDMTKIGYTQVFRSSLAGLQTLRLGVGFIHHHRPEGSKEIPIVPAWLTELSSLRKLQLDLSGCGILYMGSIACDLYHEYLTFDQVFPAVKQFPSLRELDLVALKLEYSQLERLLEMCPELEALYINCIELLSGTWEEAFEALGRRSLKQFKFTGPMAELKHKGHHFRPQGEKYMIGGAGREFFKEISLWITGRGPRP